MIQVFLYNNVCFKKTWTIFETDAIRIRLAWLIFLLHPDVAKSLLCCVSLEKLNWDSQQVRDLGMSGCNNKKFPLGQSYSYSIMRKVWYHQIWIQNNLGRFHGVRPNVGQKSSQFFVHILGGTITSWINSEIYWPLAPELADRSQLYYKLP